MQTEIIMTAMRSMVLVVLGLGLAACDPARTGYYHGSFPDPVRISMPADVTPMGVTMTLRQRSDTRRWVELSYGDSLAASSGQDTTLPTLWLYMAYSLGRSTGSDVFGDEFEPEVVLGTVSGVPDYVYMLATQDTDVQPTGPSGDTLALTEGFHVFHRGCSAGTPNHFEEVPLDTRLVYDTVAAQRLDAGLEPHLEACGVHVAPGPPVLDLGTAGGGLPGSLLIGVQVTVTDVAWAPTSDVVYFMIDWGAYDPAQIVCYHVGAAAPIQVASGDYHSPLEVATGGTSLLVNGALVGWDNYRQTYGPTSAARVRLSLDLTEMPLQTPLPFADCWPCTSRPTFGVLSPDGNTVASNLVDETGIALVDVRNLTVASIRLGTGRPMAWDPSGTKLLVQTSDTRYRIVPVDGSPPTELPSPPPGSDALDIVPVFTAEGHERDQAFWTASGPKVVMQGDSPSSAMLAPGFETHAGVRVYDFLTGALTTLVEPTRQAPPATSLGVVVATEQVFAWAIDCAGLAETFCTSELRRLSLATGAIDVVARADGALPFAVSPDGTRIAFVYEKSIYLKTIQP
jgi:hypothetical protein